MNVNDFSNLISFLLPSELFSFIYHHFGAVIALECREEARFADARNSLPTSWRDSDQNMGLNFDFSIYAYRS